MDIIKSLLSLTVISGIITAIASIYNSKQGNDSSLDGSSKWREKLFDVASKYELTIDDVQRVRASLRMLPHHDEQKLYSFNWFTNIMIKQTDEILNNKDKYFKKKSDSERNPNNCPVKVLEKEVTEIIRLFTNFLLKYHFEFRKELGPKALLKENKNRRPNKLVKEVFAEYLKLLEKN